MRKLTVLICVVIAGGCQDSTLDRAAEKKDQAEAEKAKQKNKRSLLNPKMTQEIGKFVPAEGRKVSDSKGKYTNPITGPLEMYGPMLEKISKMHIHQAVEMFRAQHGRYPEDYDEFMEKIIKPNGSQIRLPKLPGNLEYQYDQDAHKLVVVEKKE